MSRNKENIPLNPSDRQNGSLRSSSKYLPSDEFFTDSLLDATRLSSRIPSPSPQKQPLTKARRARTLRNTRNAQTSNHRSSVPENAVPRARQKSVQPSTPQRNGNSLGRLRTYSLSTPPGSSDDLPLASPYASISSPPPQDLTDTYRQIEDEDDLAQTERELSSDGSNEIDGGQAQSVRINFRSKSESPLKAPITLPISSAASTPTRSLSGLNRHKRLSERTETLSEASGLSFLKEITDQGLADKLTPHVSGIARDKARLKEMWDQRPIAFSKAQRPPRFEQRPDSLHPIQRGPAFSKAARPPPNLAFNGAQIHDTVDRPGSRHSGTGSQNSSNDTRQTGEQPQHMPIRAGIQRDFHFSSNYGFPAPRSALTEQNLEQQNRGSSAINQRLTPRSSAPSLRSDRSGNDAKVLGEGMSITNGQISRLPVFRKSLPAETRPVQEEQSQVDWVAAAAEIPIPSVETSLSSEKKNSTPTSTLRVYSPEKSRRWDNDFTSHSFQVSESPPIRKQPVVKERERQKEIDGVARHAVTTSRLSEIRERQSQENLRSMSRSPAPRSSSLPIESKSDPVATRDDEADLIVEPVPDTPVVIYRSSSNSGSDKTSLTTSSERPNMDRSKSHDHLQRLARAISTTPKSSPGSTTGGSKDVEDKAIPLAIKQDDVVESQTEPVDVLESDNAVTLPPAVAQTPKVVGAWTDTILPDTVKTVRQTDSKMQYAQTPHVSTGGWIDTPAPTEQRKYTGTVPTIVEEVPEELTAGIAKDTSSSDTIKVEIPPVPAESQYPAPVQPKSALASILDQQKNRLVSQDVTAATAQEDTLNLGNDTLESLQDLLDLDENDMTTLSRLSAIEDDTRPLGEAQGEAELLERLGVKLDRLRSNVRDARKGISKLEYQVSQPSEAVVQTTPQQLLSDTICQVCNQQTFHPHKHPEITPRFFSHASLILHLPIPILFRRSKPDQWLPRPTPLGALTLTIWLWYLLENTMCELYCRPAYTDFYVWPAEREPEFPFVIPTMLARWTRLNDLALGSGLAWAWTVLAGLVRALWRIITMSVGWSDGFVADNSGGSMAADDAAATIVKSVVQTVSTAALNSAASLAGVDFSMNDDEFL